MYGVGSLDEENDYRGTTWVMRYEMQQPADIVINEISQEKENVRVTATRMGLC